MREVLNAIRATAARDPDRIAVTHGDAAITYGDLAVSIASVAGALIDSPAIVGTLMPRGIPAIVIDLALASLGRTIVPLPEFFSVEQWRHIAADAAVGAVVSVAPLDGRARELGLPVLLAGDHDGPAVIENHPSRRVIYTSGTTGKPKGVVLEETALSASLTGLERAVLPEAADIHLSVLPFSLLLEQLAGILLPLKAGARIHIVDQPQLAPVEAERVRPTTTVLVPDLLAGWAGWLRQTGRKAPGSLRFVAAGGAPVGTGLADLAWSVGLPVHEGYGLSECCSVVAVNRPGQRRARTVGRPLDGVTVTIDDGEIVVSGPTVMSGYLGGASAGGVWRTGDLGRLDANGDLVVFGRKDDVVVTANGRNIHPEWIEPMLLADPGIRRAAIIAGRLGVRAVLVTADGATSPDGWLARTRDLTASAPDYAKPAEVTLISPERAQSHDLFTPDGRPRRRRIARFLSEASMKFHDTLIQATTPERQNFMSIPVIAEAVAHGVDMSLYLAFLNSAYHHVRHTVPLLRTALAACGPEDAALAEGLRAYIDEETGHEEWILNDIEALGGDGEASRHARPPRAVRVMVSYGYRLIEEEGPHALLGMVHVLEGMSVALAVAAAEAIKARLAPAGEGGFSYLMSHGGLDVGHVDDFARLLDAIDEPRHRATVIAAAKDFYVLYGDVFREIAAARPGEASHAA
ncbi:hypothetical protein N825_25020 [Skermanella stibiiresistens SB22]|uniref:AMP-dependent synthetase/ligase domain-containing protein n=1 Tax=Skermanella stibiiresistens SB22 TaxID=1385369 RepID=W9H6K3_9PROT|nr:AMP-binding protein [Skermanella stibiiresistens]EWY41865.1 hypothetical protein N825_25020 [Skermanella stibiiresistens SB22]